MELDSIAAGLGISDEEVIENLSEAIDRQILIGKIDLIARTFHRVPGLAEWQAKKRVLEDAAVLAIRIQAQKLPAGREQEINPEEEEPSDEGETGPGVEELPHEGDVDRDEGEPVEEEDVDRDEGDVDRD
jgi:hypothetical protein